MNDYLSISLWRAAALLGKPQRPIILIALPLIWVFLKLAWREDVNEKTLGLSLATGFVFTLYANGDHYVVLIPALLFVLEKNCWLGLMANLATWTPLLRLKWGYDTSPVDIAYPALLVCSIYYLSYKQKRVSP